MLQIGGGGAEVTLFKTITRSQRNQIKWRDVALRFGMAVALKRYNTELWRDSGGTVAHVKNRCFPPNFILPFHLTLVILQTCQVSSANKGIFYEDDWKLSNLAKKGKHFGGFRRERQFLRSSILYHKSNCHAKSQSCNSFLVEFLRLLVLVLLSVTSAPSPLHVILLIKTY